MSDVIIPYRFLWRGGTAAAVGALNEVVRYREAEAEFDTGRFKFGDGVTAYASLLYAGIGYSDLTGLSDGDVLIWDATAGNWVVGPQSGGGGASPAMQFDADTGSTADSDPGAGLVKWNNATQGSATFIYMDDQTSDGVSVVAMWPELRSGGFLYLQHATDQDTWQIWEITAVTDATGYVKFAVLLIANGGSFADADPMLITIQNGRNDLSAYAPLDSPVFINNPRGPTPSVGDNDTSLATTAFVTTAVANGPTGQGAWTLIRKASDESRTSNTTLTNDAALFMAMAAGTRYRLKIFIAANQVGSTPGFKFAFIYSGTTSIVEGRRSQMLNGGSASTAIETALFNSVYSTASGGTSYFEWEYIITTTTSGTLNFQWAQNTSSGNAVTIRAGSFFEYFVC